MSGLKMVWLVSIPDWLNPGEYVIVERFYSREGARGYLLERWGMPENVADFFVTKVTDG